MIKILHLAKDEKFIDAANYLYEKAFPGSNTFLIVLPRSKNYNIKYISLKKNYILLHGIKQAEEKVREIIQYYDLIVLHGFDFFKALIVNRYPEKIFNYIIFGGEIYNRHKKFRESIYGNKTIKYVKQKRTLQEVLKNIYYFYKYKVIDIYRFQFKQLKKINYFSAILKEDYELLLKENIITHKTQYLKFTYYPIEFIFGENKDLTVNNNNILLGNSASWSNNHIEAIDMLSEININKQKVIIPLSYGNKEYAKVVENYATKKLGDKIKVLKEFIPLQDYNKILQSCGIVIMNHYRQQAIGNILASMWMGAKIFLDKRNTFYHYLKRIGCYVYSMEELSNDNINLLNKEQIQHNRNVLLKEIGTDAIVNYMKDNIPLLIQNSDRNNTNEQH